MDCLIRRHLHQDGLKQNHDSIPGKPTTKRIQESRPIDAFGIVAAMCAPLNRNNTMNNDGIIGVNGKLPWDSLSTDRKIFEFLTRDRILIVGRRTLLNERDGNLDHVRHAKHCIVVSKSLSSSKEDPRRITGNKLEDGNLEDFLKVASSLDEALDLARDLATELDNNNVDSGKGLVAFKDFMHYADSEKSDSNNNRKPIPSFLSSNAGNLQCWVAGGEQLYEEALQHRSALELHLSVVDVEVDVSSRDVAHVAMFPPKHRWDHNYELFKKTFFPIKSSNTKTKQDPKPPEPSFVYHIYKRIF